MYPNRFSRTLPQRLSTCFGKRQRNSADLTQLLLRNSSDSEARNELLLTRCKGGIIPPLPEKQQHEDKVLFVLTSHNCLKLRKFIKFVCIGKGIQMEKAHLRNNWKFGGDSPPANCQLCSKSQHKTLQPFFYSAQPAGTAHYEPPKNHPTNPE